MGQLEFYRIKSDINKLKQTIENRIGVKIGIEHDQYDDYLIIKPDVYKTLNEVSAFIKNQVQNLIPIETKKTCAFEYIFLNQFWTNI